MRSATNPRQRLRALATRIFPEDADFRAFLAEAFPKQAWKDPARPSTLELSERQVTTAYNALRQSGSGTNPTRPNPSAGRYFGAGERGDDGARLTQAQADLIAALQDQLGWTNDALLVFVQRQCGKSLAISWLSRAQATDLLTGMKRVKQDRTR